MNIYQKLLNYYLDSENFFGCRVLQFLEQGQHITSCRDADGRTHKCTTDVYAIWIDEGFPINDPYCYPLKIPENKIINYFSTNYSDEQLFAIIFGRICGLTEKQLAYVENQVFQNQILTVLQYFVCHPGEERLPSENIPFVYPERYYISDVLVDAGSLKTKITAPRVGNTLTDSCGNSYTIFDEDEQTLSHQIYKCTSGALKKNMKGGLLHDGQN